MKIYRGHRYELHRVTVTVEQTDPQAGGRRALQHHVKHSPTGFEWGYAGSGPADLARCLLIDVLQEDNPAPELYQAFKLAVVAGLPDAWELSEEQISRTLDGIKTAARERLEELERADADDTDEAATEPAEKRPADQIVIDALRGPRS